MNSLQNITRTTIAILSVCFFLESHAQVRMLSGKVLSGKEIDAFLQNQMDSLKIPALSFAIIQHGKVVYFKVAGIKNAQAEPVDSTALFEAASMTKPIFAYAVHKLMQRGLINLDTPLYKYYPFEDIDHDDRYKRITARMVLSHTTGFPNWRGGGGSELTMLFEPGTRYGYSGEGFEYLGLVVKHLLNKRIPDIIEEEVFCPLSIDNSFLVKNQYAKDHMVAGLKDNKEWGKNAFFQRPNVAFSLCTEAREYAKFVIQLMKESNMPNTPFQQMSAPQIQSEPNKWACLGIFMEQTPFGIRYGHSGNNNNRYTSNFEFYKDQDIGYVFFMNCDNEHALTQRLNDFLVNGN